MILWDFQAVSSKQHYKSEIICMRLWINAAGLFPPRPVWTLNASEEGWIKNKWCVLLQRQVPPADDSPPRPIANDTGKLVLFHSPSWGSWHPWVCAAGCWMSSTSLSLPVLCWGGSITEALDFVQSNNPVQHLRLRLSLLHTFPVAHFDHLVLNI